MQPGENYGAVAASVEDEARRSGREAGEVRLIAVSKTVGLEAVDRAIALGARDFGENRPDCLVEKASARPDVRWHFIGNIQSRRIPDIVAYADLVHSLFQMSHAEKISAAAVARGKVQDVLVEVNVSGEESKGGLAPADVPGFVREALGLPGLRVAGLMTMAPQGDSEAARETFEGLARLRDEVAAELDAEDAAAFKELSMGMSEDWPEAVRCGATMVRIGRAVFSDMFVG